MKYGVLAMVVSTLVLGVGFKSAILVNDKRQLAQIVVRVRMMAIVIKQHFDDNGLYPDNLQQLLAENELSTNYFGLYKSSIIYAKPQKNDPNTTVILKVSFKEYSITVDKMFKVDVNPRPRPSFFPPS